jgi:hypothetical protein
MTEVVEMGPLLVSRVLCQLTLVLGDKGEFQGAPILLDFMQGHGARWRGFELGHDIFSSSGLVRRGAWLLVHAEVRRLEAQLEQIFAPREGQGTLLRRETSALLQEIGHVIGGKGAVL